MTCQELRLYFEDPFHGGTGGRLDAEHTVHEHQVHCTDCARFVEARRELEAGLRLVRQSVPALPASLDGVALTNYRRQIAECLVPADPILRRRRFALLSWSAAVAVVALVLASGILLFQGRKPVTIVMQPQSAPATQPAVRAGVAARISKPKALRAATGRQRQRPTPAVSELPSPLPAGFRSLMYCDELSCGGTFEVIRVQLPSPTTAFAAPSNATNGVVVADVLVGPDGIARGIRIVE